MLDAGAAGAVAAGTDADGPGAEAVLAGACDPPHETMTGTRYIHHFALDLNSMFLLYNGAVGGDRGPYPHVRRRRDRASGRFIHDKCRRSRPRWASHGRSADASGQPRTGCTGPAGTGLALVWNGGPTMLTRREFLSQTGYVTLVLAPLAAACGSSSSSTGGGSCDGVSSTSTVVSAHSHTVCVPTTDLASPPPGGMTYTSSGPEPVHTITLTAAQLTSIQGGQSVTVTSSSAGAHTHDFTIAKATAARQRTGNRIPRHA